MIYCSSIQSRIVYFHIVIIWRIYCLRIGFPRIPSLSHLVCFDVETGNWSDRKVVGYNSFSFKNIWWWATESKEIKPEMFPSKDIWMCAVSAAMGAIIVILVFVLLPRCGDQVIRTRKVPQEHDERTG